MRQWTKTQRATRRISNLLATLQVYRSIGRKRGAYGRALCCCNRFTQTGTHTHTETEAETQTPTKHTNICTGAGTNTGTNADSDTGTGTNTQTQMSGRLNTAFHHQEGSCPRKLQYHTTPHSPAGTTRPPITKIQEASCLSLSLPQANVLYPRQTHALGWPQFEPWIWSQFSGPLFVPSAVGECLADGAGILPRTCV